MNKEELLVVENLSTRFFTYGGVVEALDNVSFTIYKGEIFCLVGESGCGKSVTALSILRLIPKPGEIVSGRIIFNNEDLIKKTEREMAKIRGSKISIIFQDPTSSLNPVFKIGEQVAMPLLYHQNLKHKAAWRRAINLFERVKLPDPIDKAKAYPHELSGGMRQRVMIAMALGCHPDLLIADEPTTNLDVTIEQQILSLIKELQRDYGTSVLLITHDLGVVAKMCDRVAVMYAGNIVELADVMTIFYNPKHPYTEKLEKAIPGIKGVGQELEEIPGVVPRLINPPPGCRFHPRCEYVRDICEREKPQKVEIEPDHLVFCHLYGNFR